MALPKAKLTRLGMILACWVLTSSSNAWAQTADLALSELALRWAEGEFGSPLICHIDGEPVRGLRRISIESDALRTRNAVARISFTDLEIENATRCFTELSPSEPNIIGWIQIRLPGSHGRDTGQRDFREAIRRKRGFEFAIKAGVLGIQQVRQPLAPPKRVQFSGGTATLTGVRPGTDTARLLGGFKTPRKLLLELEAKDGTKLAFPLYVPER